MYQPTIKCLLSYMYPLHLLGYIEGVLYQSVNIIYLVRDREFVSRAIAKKFDLDMHTSQSRVIMSYFLPVHD